MEFPHGPLHMNVTVAFVSRFMFLHFFTKFCLHVYPIVSDSVTLGLQPPPSLLCVLIFPSQEYWSGLPFPYPGDLPQPRIEPVSSVSPTLTGGFFTTEPPGKPLMHYVTGHRVQSVAASHSVYIVCSGLLMWAQGPPLSPGSSFCL